jgi:hypothetical protein
MPSNRIVFDEELNYLDARRGLYLPCYNREVSRAVEGPTRSDEGPKVLPSNNTVIRPLAYHITPLLLRDVWMGLVISALNSWRKKSCVRISMT